MRMAVLEVVPLKKAERYNLWNGTSGNVFGLASTLTMTNEGRELSRVCNTAAEHFSGQDVHLMFCCIRSTDGFFNNLC